MTPTAASAAAASLRVVGEVMRPCFPPDVQAPGRGNSKIWQTQGIPRIRVAPRSVPCRDVARLLVVEDDDAISEPLVRALAREGHEVAHAVTGAEALGAGRRARLDLVVLDIGLPDIDGVEVCRRVRAGHPRVAILILTAPQLGARRGLGASTPAPTTTSRSRSRCRC